MIKNPYLWWRKNKRFYSTCLFIFHLQKRKVTSVTVNVSQKPVVGVQDRQCAPVVVPSRLMVSVWKTAPVNLDFTFLQIPRVSCMLDTSVQHFLLHPNRWRKWAVRILWQLSNLHTSAPDVMRNAQKHVLVPVPMNASETAKTLEWVYISWSV